MLVYDIEQIEPNKFRKKKIIIIVIIIILVLILSVLGGIKTAKFVAERKQELGNNVGIANEEKENTQTDENTKNDENTQNNDNNPNDINEEQPSKGENTNKNKLSQEQITAINNIYKSNEKRAFLTFDDGPSNSVTPVILDILKQNDIKATFFVLGTMVKTRPEVLKREYEEGHYIANHGYSHVYNKVYKDENTPLEEYKKTNEIIQKALGNSDYQSNVFRFPGGSEGGHYNDIKEKAKEKFKEEGIAYLDWNCLTSDAAGAETKEDIMASLKDTCKNKNSIVVLMHDAPNKDLTAETLQDVINYLKEQGYGFKNLYDI